MEDYTSRSQNQSRAHSEILKIAADGNEEVVVSEPSKIHLYTDIHLVEESELLYWVSGGFPDTDGNTEWKSVIMRSDFNGKNKEMIVEPFHSRISVDIEVDYTYKILYWHTNNELKRANLNGENQETILQDAAVYDFELTSDSKKVYWFDSDEMEILLSDINGSNKNTVISGFDDCFSSLEIDNAHKKLYWTNRHGLLRSNFDGGNVETVVEQQPDTACNGPSNIELIPNEDELYWQDFDDNIIRSFLDGSNQETMVSVDLALATFAVLRQDKRSSN